MSGKQSSIAQYVKRELYTEDVPALLSRYVITIEEYELMNRILMFFYSTTGCQYVSGQLIQTNQTQVMTKLTRDQL